MRLIIILRILVLKQSIHRQGHLDQDWARPRPGPGPSPGPGPGPALHEQHSYKDPGCWIQDPGSWIHDPDSGSRLLDPGSKIITNIRTLTRLPTQAIALPRVSTQTTNMNAVRMRKTTITNLTGMATHKCCVFLCCVSPVFRVCHRLPGVNRAEHILLKVAYDKAYGKEQTDSQKLAGCCAHGTAVAQVGLRGQCTESNAQWPPCALSFQ